MSSKTKTGCGLVVLIALFAIPSIMLTYGNEEEITITVREKYMVRGTSDVIQHVVDNKGQIYTCDDRFLIGHWNSGSNFSSLVVGESYKVTVVGYRWPSLSIFRNIIKVKNIE